MKNTLLDQYKEACNYPGILNISAVEENIAKYVAALGIKRKIVHLQAGWEVSDHESLDRYVNNILDDMARRDPSFASDARVAIDASDARDTSVAIDARYARVARDARDARDARVAIVASDARYARVARDASVAINARVARDARVASDARDAIVASDASVARDALVAIDAIDAIVASVAIDARVARVARDALVARVARVARDALVARVASDAIDAIDARVARVARDAIDARYAIDARALKRFTSWCIYRSMWWWVSEISWVSTTYLGALETGNKKVQEWSEPLFHAFLNGAWILHWTDDTVFWVSKPIVHVEKLPNGNRRLHNDNWPALESDVESLYFIHGVLVPAFVVVRPDWITLNDIETETNAEVRRIMIGRYGYERYLSEVKATCIDSCSEDHPIKGLRTAKLHKIGDDIILIDMLNSTPEPDGTTKRYFLPIDGDRYNGDAGRNCHAAMASTWRVKGRETELLFDSPRFKNGYKDYRPGFES